MVVCGCAEANEEKAKVAEEEDPEPSDFVKPQFTLIAKEVKGNQPTDRRVGWGRGSCVSCVCEGFAHALACDAMRWDGMGWDGTAAAAKLPPPPAGYKLEAVADKKPEAKAFAAVVESAAPAPLVVPKFLQEKADALPQYVV